MSDNFNVLIVYVHALGAVYPLYLFHQVLLDCLPAQNVQYILGIDRAIGKLLPRLYLVSSLNTNMGGGWDNILSLLFLFIIDKQLTIFNTYLTIGTDWDITPNAGDLTVRGDNKITFSILTACLLTLTPYIQYIFPLPFNHLGYIQLKIFKTT